MGLCTKRNCFVFIKTFCVLLNLFCVVTVIAVFSSDSERRTIRLIQDGYDCSEFVQDTVSLPVASTYVRTYVHSQLVCVCSRAWVNMCEAVFCPFAEQGLSLRFVFASYSIASLASNSD